MKPYQHKAIPDEWIKASVAQKLLEKVGRRRNKSTIWKWMNSGRIAYRVESDKGQYSVSRLEVLAFQGVPKGNPLKIGTKRPTGIDAEGRVRKKKYQELAQKRYPDAVFEEIQYDKGGVGLTIWSDESKDMMVGTFPLC
jgi:hypothetical protein